MLQAEGFAAHCLREPVQRAEWLESVREAFSKSTPMRAQLATQPCVRQMLESLTPHEREVLDLAVTGAGESKHFAVVSDDSTKQR
jgi:FixJ family two-component response regulator